jgi:hypothetical protein
MTLELSRSSMEKVIVSDFAIQYTLNIEPLSMQTIYVLYLSPSIMISSKTKAINVLKRYIIRIGLACAISSSFRQHWIRYDSSSDRLKVQEKDIVYYL